MEGQDAPRRLQRSTVGLGWTLSLAAVLSFLLVSSSRDFANYSLFPVLEAHLFLSTLAAGLLLGSIARRVLEASLMLAGIVLIPNLVYGTALVVMPVRMGSIVLLDILIFLALQRLVVYVLFMSVLGVVGLAVGAVVTSRKAEVG